MLWRSAGASAVGDLLGQCEPGRAPILLRREQALRRSDYDGLSSHVQRPHNIARIFNTYGPRMALNDGRVVPAFLDQALKGEDLRIFGDGSQTRSFCFVSDMVNGLLLLSESDERYPVNLGNPIEMTILQFAEEVRARF